jgi:hypothetical protein
MTAKEFVISKYPNAFLKGKKNIKTKATIYSVYLNENERVFVWNYRANWAWAEAKREILKQQNQQTQ